jgi:hypothetical protein
LLEGAENSAGLRCSGRGGDLRGGAAKAAYGEEAVHGGGSMVWTGGECRGIQVDREMATGSFQSGRTGLV